jgi:hypothetical protein
MPAHRPTRLGRILLSERVFFVVSRAVFLLGLFAVIAAWVSTISIRDTNPLALVASVLSVALAFAALVYVRAYAARVYARKLYLAALQEPEPIATVEVVEELRRTWGFGMAAMVTLQVVEGQALAHALYGRGAAAMSVLSTLHWPAQTMPARAQGLWVEGVIALLCDRDAARGLELARSALELAQKWPLTRAVRDNYTALVALGETCAGHDLSIAARQSAERAARKNSSVPSQLIAHLTLALDAERRGDPNAASHRDFLRRTAPLCAGLALTRADLGTGTTSSPGPVSQALGAPAPHVLAAPAQALAIRMAMIFVPMFCLMCVGFILLYNFVADGR